ncbi:MAG: protoheme IX farnesyltransferase [Ignavibacteria bacterium]|nr:protoheme IX farnesyltransferase [Ignavibacteria bacterium]
MKINIKDILTFTKFRISFSVSISSLLGYVLATHTIDFDIIWLLLSILFLASGSSGLNQVQEWRYDAIMNRTMERPIPRNRLSVFSGSILSFSLLLGGFLILLLSTSNFLPILLATAAVLIYNAGYTPLKRISPFSALPGAIIGAIPPAIGWTYAGGDILHPLNLALATFFFVWQIPHFWLLLLVYEEDYKRANFPVLTDIFTPLQLARISFIWILLLVGLGFLIIFLLNTFNAITLSITVLLSLLLIARTHKMIKILQPLSFYKYAFIQLNFFVLFMTILLTFNKIIGH